jgi:hypothetical protein
LYAAGYFDTAGGNYCREIARWNGEKWDSLNGNNLCGEAYTMLVADSILYLGGDMFSSPDCLTNEIASWDGNKLHDLNFRASGAGVVYSLAWFDDELYTAGNFDVVNGDHSIVSIARSVIATGITSTMKEDPSFQIYPNPAQDEVTVSFPFSNNIIAVYDLCGSEEQHFKIGYGNSAQLNIHSFQKGVYVVEIKDEKGNLIASGKLFKE